MTFQIAYNRLQQLYPSELALLIWSLNLFVNPYNIRLSNLFPCLGLHFSPSPSWFFDRHFGVGIRDIISGLEIVGVLASVSQLLDYSLIIMSPFSEIYSRVKDAPEGAHRHLAQIYQLIETARLIQQQSELYCKLLVHIHVKSTLDEEGKLQKILDRVLLDYTQSSRKKRVWKAILGDKERRMVTCFDRLKKEKTALILCITCSQGETLQYIRDGFGELIPSVDLMPN
jgi:hypothetical protein